MMTMSDEGDRTCPLCAEEMDLTDQQLKPCKCGYEICVWCWHHIIEMAEKEDTEGRCPACRAPYDKDRIVGSAAKCERVVSESCGERRQKSQKAKQKISADARLHLSNARVVQRNLVYIIGIPLSLADESVLESRDYFGQYGRVLKVSISRPTNTIPQNTNNSTFSVYITYAKEEEAVQCIQAVHNFVLEGKSLKAYFGTTKYCHAWLRNTTCTNPDCLYLHEIGCQEERFTKDEIISSYTRCRVSNNLQRRQGSTLPSSLDDLSSSSPSSAKTGIKNSSYTSAIPVKISTNHSSTSKSSGLPAAASWGSRSSQPSLSTIPCLQSSSHRDQDRQDDMFKYSSTILERKQISAWQDDADNYKGRDLTAASKLPSEKKNIMNHTSAWHDNELETVRMPGQMDSMNSAVSSWYSESSKTIVDKDSYTVVSNSLAETTCAEHICSAWDDDDDDDVDIVNTTGKVSQENDSVHLVDKSLESSGPEADDKRTELSDSSEKSVLSASCASETYACAYKEERSCNGLSHHDTLKGEDMNALMSEDLTKCSYISCSKNKISENVTSDKLVQESASSFGNLHGLSAEMSSLNVNCSDGVRNELLIHNVSRLPESETIYTDDQIIDIPSLPLKKPSSEPTYSHVSKQSTEKNLELLNTLLPNRSEKSVSSENAFDQGLLSSTDVSQMYFVNSVESLHIDNSSRNTWDDGYKSEHLTENVQVVKTNGEASVLARADHNLLANGNHLSNLGRSFKYEPFSEYHNQMLNKEEKYIGESNGILRANNVTGIDAGENSIISKILDFNLWDDSLNAANDFVKMLRETDKQRTPTSLSGSRNRQLSNQSRFSFAREDNKVVLNRPSSSENSTSYVRATASPSQDGFGIHFQDNNTKRNVELSSLFNNVHSSGKISDSTLSREKMPAPPGFSVRSRAPPPGFATEEIQGQNYDDVSSENQLLRRTSVQHPPPGSTCDVEFIDPAILAVGKGHLPPDNEDGILVSSFPTGYFSDVDPRLQLLMRHSMPAISLMASGQIRDGSFPLHDTFVPQFISSDQNSLSSFGISIKQPNNPQISYSQWGNQSDANFRIAESFSTERLGPTKHFHGRDAPKFNMYNSNDHYSRAFGM